MQHRGLGGRPQADVPKNSRGWKPQFNLKTRGKVFRYWNTSRYIKTYIVREQIAKIHLHFKIKDKTSEAHPPAAGPSGLQLGRGGGGAAAGVGGEGGCSWGRRGGGAAAGVGGGGAAAGGGGEGRRPQDEWGWGVSVARAPAAGP